MRESTSYVYWKLGEALQDFIGHKSVDQLLSKATEALRFHRYDELSQDTMESMVGLRLALGLEVEEIAAPIPTPWPVSRLPDRRRKELADRIVSSLRDLSKFVGVTEATRKLPVPDSLPRLSRICAYSHLAWDGYEDCPEYLSFLREAFPSYPDDVLRQWFQRHGRSALGLPLSDALRFESLTFRLETWSTERVLAASTRDDALNRPGFRRQKRASILAEPRRRDEWQAVHG